MNIYTKNPTPLFKRFSLSAKELSSVKGVSVCAMLLALRVVLGYFSNLTLAINQDIKIGFTFLPIAIAAITLGPVAGMIVGGLGDIISFFLVPMGPYFFGWTLNGILVGLLYGIFLYKNHCKVLHLIISKILICSVEILLGSLWLYIMYNKGFLIVAGTRTITQLVLFPIESVLIYIVANLVCKKIKWLR